MIYERYIASRRDKLRYKERAQGVTFGEVIILLAINKEKNTISLLKEELLIDRSYIIRTLKELVNRKMIEENLNQKPKRYSVTNLGSRALKVLDYLD